MALVPLPQQGEIVDPAWGQQVATKLNAGNIAGALGDLILSTPNQSSFQGIPNSSGPCIVVVQGTIRIDGPGQYAGMGIGINNALKASVLGSGQGTGGHWFPASVTMAIAEGQTAQVWFGLGAAAIAAQITGVSYVVTRVSGTATPTAADLIVDDDGATQWSELAP
jgi:hypothetical protein